jgi:diaminohydroxyphosphoribosylaminopyrimidine deaminase/5-amino-6-(5-phosphoribosylamino)uracil reductase
MVLDRSGKIDNSDGWLVLRHQSLEQNIAEITEKGITSILVEAGAKLNSAFLESGMVDMIYWFRAPIIIGEAGLSAAATLQTIEKLRVIEYMKLGNDSLEILECLQG